MCRRKTRIEGTVSSSYRPPTHRAGRSLEEDMSGETSRENPGLEDPSPMQLVRSWQRAVEAQNRRGRVQTVTALQYLPTHAEHYAVDRSSFRQFRQSSTVQSMPPPCLFTALYVAIIEKPVLFDYVVLLSSGTCAVA